MLKILSEEHAIIIQGIRYRFYVFQFVLKLSFERIRFYVFQYVLQLSFERILSNED